MMRRLAVALSAACLCACAHSPLPNEHALWASAETDARFTAAHFSAPQLDTTMVISSCAVPAGIDRPQFVLGAATGETRIVDGERWSEPLKVAIPRAIARRIMQVSPAVAVWSSPAAAPARPDVRLDIEVIEWRSVLGDHAYVDLLWHLRRGDATRSGRSRSKVETQGGTYGALAAAHRTALTLPADDIAGALSDLLQKPQR